MNEQNRMKVVYLFMSVIFVFIAVISYVLRAPVIAAAYLFFGLIGLSIASRFGIKAKEIFASVYCCNIIAVVFLYIIYFLRFGMPYYGGGSDDWFFEFHAEQVAAYLGVFDYHLIRGNIVSQFHNSVGYVYFVSILFRLAKFFGGFHTLVPRFFNSLLLALIAILVFNIARTQMKLRKNICIFSALYLGLSPIMVYYSAHTFRDTLVSFILITLLYSWSYVSNLSMIKKSILCVMTVFLVISLWEIRQFSAIMAIGLIGLAILYNKQGNQDSEKMKNKIKYIALIAVLFVAIGLLYTNGMVHWFFERIKYLQSYYADYRIGQSNGLAYYVFSAPQPLGFILRIAYLAISPLPVITTRIERLLVDIGTIVQIFLLPFVGIGIWKMLREKYNLHILFAFLVIFCTIASTTFQGRHITMYYPYACLVGCYGYQYYKDRGYRISGIFIFMYFMIIFASCGYILLKGGL